MTTHVFGTLAFGLLCWLNWLVLDPGIDARRALRRQKLLEVKRAAR